MNKTILRSLNAAKFNRNQEILDEEAYIKLCKDLGGLYKTLGKVYKKQYQDSLYNAFLLSLDVIATRIPTQNMSSIMIMKVAAFTGSNINNVFVTKWQQWLQGSDYDIDKLYIMSFALNDDGTLPTFSNLMHKYVVKNPTEILALNSPNGVRYTEHISGLPSGIGKRNNLLGKIPCAQLTENS